MFEHIYVFDSRYKNMRNYLTD